MYEKYGEFDSWEELNQAAEGFKAERDTESIKGLAEENGIDPYMAEAYISGAIPTLCDVATAAFGKLDIEKESKEVKAYESKIPAQPIVEHLKSHCDNAEFARKIRKKRKSLTKCLAHVEKEAKKKVDKSHPYLPDAVVFGMAREYYKK